MITHVAKPKVEEIKACQERTHPIDVVFTWVNGTDPEWKKIREQYKGENKTPDLLENVRFNNSAQAPDIELSTAIGSVLKNMSWVQTIHVLTMRPQIPQCLLGKFYQEYASGRIRLVHHDQIWPNPNDLPVFNSMAIESNLHRIPNLAEHFIYFNDDCCVNRPCDPDMFFCNGKSVQRGTWMPGRVMNVFKVNALNTIAHQCKLMNIHSYFHPAHVAIALTKSLMLDCEREFPKEFENIRRQRFRGNDHIIPHFFAVNLALRNTTAVMRPKDPVNIYVLNYSLQPFSRFLFNNQSIQLKNYHLICINDVPESDQSRVYSIIQQSMDS